jgi:hypothetical protein
MMRRTLSGRNVLKKGLSGAGISHSINPACFNSNKSQRAMAVTSNGRITLFTSVLSLHFGLLNMGLANMISFTLGPFIFNVLPEIMFCDSYR